MAMDWKAMQGWRGWLDRDAILDRLGLEERTPTGDFFTGLGLFSIGVLVGAGLGLMFAPKRGEEMRATLNEALRSKMRSAQEAAQELGAEAGVTTPPAH